jgi:two-component sensor histidine kinase
MGLNKDDKRAPINKLDDSRRNRSAQKSGQDYRGESTALFKAIVEAFDGLIYVCSRDYKVEFMNEKFIQRTGRNPVGEFCYKALHNLDSVCPWCVNERVFDGETVRWEVKSPKDHRWFHVVNTLVRNPDGRMSKMAMIQDITERKTTEEQIKANLQEKEILLREIHHRVKNNLAVISSLLNLRTRTGAKKTVEEQFRDVQSQIRAMVLAHEQVYQTENLSEIPIKNYLIRLINELKESNMYLGQNIRFHLELEDVVFGPDTAIPLGLITNELITNSLKHAFPDGASGDIWIVLKAADYNQYELTVKDSGVGLTMTGDLNRKRNIGLDLVEALSKQLRGDFSVSSAHGTENRLVFSRIDRVSQLKASDIS